MFDFSIVDESVCFFFLLLIDFRVLVCGLLSRFVRNFVLQCFKWFFDNDMVFLDNRLSLRFNQGPCY